MKILVTGATGFLGQTLCRHLSDAGHMVVGLGSKDADLTDATSLLRYNQHRYDYVYHLAAWTQAGDFCLRHPGEQWIKNQQINTTVLAWWRDCQFQAKMVGIGTSCSYAPHLATTEESYLQGMPIDSLLAYAMTKRMLYVGLQAIQRQYGGSFVYVVPSTLYGPGYHTDERQLHFIFDLIRKILRGKYHGEPVVLWGDGEQTRELIYLEDFVHCLLDVGERCENDIINIGTGEARSIKYFANKICEYVGYPFERVQFDPAKYVGARSKFLNIDKLKKHIPQLSFTKLEAGLAKTIDWFHAQKGWEKSIGMEG
ncbi:MAG: NAD-dependent epimerase/dehydratase family protein [Nitrospirales bacterium]|nr:NAD-dependent epimerase/dehydratase family protein [Nitrospira sp.]MDR4502346.1 NAD-dependent epimerase/dehydratase family protein [Nitrospirales bacterium]